MNNDDLIDVERAAARYRPAGPSALFRERILNARPAQPRHSSGLVWFAAAAALVLSATLHHAASTTFSALNGRASAHADEARNMEIDELAALLGGGDWARREAIRLLTIADERARTLRSSAHVEVETLWNQ